jgi:hypothetical protein
MMCGLVFAIVLISLLFYLLNKYVTQPFEEKKYHEAILLEDDEIPITQNENKEDHKK